MKMNMMKAVFAVAVAMAVFCAQGYGVAASTRNWTDPETGIHWSIRAFKLTSVYAVTSTPTTVSGVITIPANIQGVPTRVILEDAFNACFTWLTSVTIPPSVTNIVNNPFAGCHLLREIIVDENNEFYRSEDGFLLSNDETLLVASIGDKATVTIPNSVTSIGDSAFSGCSGLTSVTIPDSVTSIGDSAFSGCSGLTSVTIPDSVTSIGDEAFSGCSSLKKVEFKGAPPIGVKDSGILGYCVHTFPREYGAQWQKLLADSHLGGFIQPNKPVVEYVFVKVRENDPTILDCIYRVKSGKPTVKVRALAFKDGGRSFANVVRPETFIEGTEANIGDAISANEEHKLSWKVSADWNIDLAKVSFEVLATEDQLLPLELRTIPANGTNKAMEFSWNAITSDQVFSALLWLYADKDAGVTLSSGVLKNGSTTLASGASLSNLNASSYVFSKMGFLLLSGSNLTYVNTMSRLGLSPSGALQYAYRWIGE